MPATTRTLARTAVAALASFPAIVILLNVLQLSTYSAQHQAMSELALGKGGSLMFLAFTAMGVGTGLVAVVIHRELPPARVTPIALAAAALLDLVSAVFHTNADGAPTTMSSNIHTAAGVTTFLLVVVAMFASVHHLRRSAKWRWYAMPTLLWSVVAFGTFFLIPMLGDQRFGMAQRMFVGTWLSWMLVTAALVAASPSQREPQMPSTATLS